MLILKTFDSPLKQSNLYPIAYHIRKGCYYYQYVETIFPGFFIYWHHQQEIHVFACFHIANQSLISQNAFGVITYRFFSVFYKNKNKKKQI